MKRIYLALAISWVGCFSAFGQASLFPQNYFYAGPTSGSGFPGPRAIVGADLPNPSASTLGGVQSLTCATNQWLNTISVSGVPACAQPAFTNISGSLVCSQTPALTGAVTTTAGACATVYPNANANTVLSNWGGSASPPIFNTWPACANDGAHALVYINGTGLQCATITGGAVTSIAGNTGAFTLGAGITNNVNQLLVDPSYLRGYIAGLVLSNDGVSPLTVIDVSLGPATSDDATQLMKLPSNFTKNMNATWAVGSTNGCADGAASYTTLGASTWYFVFEIMRTDTGVVDLLCSKSATAPTYPGSYTVKRLLGAVLTDGSSHIIPFTQNANDFLWTTPVLDVNCIAPTTSSVTTTLASVPTGIVVKAFLRVGIQGFSNNLLTLVRPLTQTDQAPQATAQPVSTAFDPSTTGTGQIGSQDVWTNANAQVGVRSSRATASATVCVDTYGYMFPR